MGNVGRYWDRLISLPRDVRPVDTHVTVVSAGFGIILIPCAELWRLSSFTLHHFKYSRREGKFSVETCRRSVHSVLGGCTSLAE
jgi:hypothetical protein